MLGGNILEYSPSNPGTAMVDPRIDSESNVTTSPGMPIKLTGQGPQATKSTASARQPPPTAAHRRGWASCGLDRQKNPSCCSSNHTRITLMMPTGSGHPAIVVPRLMTMTMGTSTRKGPAGDR